MLNRSFLALGLAFALAACGDKDGGGDDTGGGSGGDGSDLNGAEVFADSCAGCHGSNGIDGFAPDLPDAVPLLSDDDLLDIIENGTGTMEAPGLNADEADAVFDYVRETFGTEGGG